MAIRYDKRITKELYKTVAQFNRKVKGLEGRSGVLIPDKITTREIKANVYDRRELKRELANLKRFLKPGAEEIVKTPGGTYTSKYDIAVLKSNVRSAKARVNAKLQKLYNTELYIYDKPTKNTYASMGNDRYLNLEAKRERLNKDIESLAPDDYERYVRLVQNAMSSDRNREWKESFLDILTKEARQFGVNETYLQNIHDKMMKLSPEKFIEVYNKELSVQSIAENYRLMMERAKKGLSLEGLQENVNTLYENLSKKIDKIVG